MCFPKGAFILYLQVMLLEVGYNGKFGDENSPADAVKF